MEIFICIVISTISLYLTIKTRKELKEKCASESYECKNVVNQRVLTAVKNFDKKGKQIIYAAVKLEGDELEHVLINLQDYSEITAEGEL